MATSPEERAHEAALDGMQPPPQLRRHLSLLRVAGVFVVVGAVVAAIVGFRTGSRDTPVALPASSFAPYVDVTATPQFSFEDPSQSSATNVVLGFIVSSPALPCQPSWGSAYSLASAATGMDLDRRIARLRQRGGVVTASFGGEANSELAIGCTDPAALTAAYKAVVDRYSISSIDLDIEGSVASAPDVSARRAQALSALQRAEHAAGHNLSVWLTLPVAPTGLTSVGNAVVASMLAAHVTLAGVNVLAMDYGQPVPKDQTMASLAESALTATERQLDADYVTVGTTLTADATWQRLGVTPMIGQNDTVSEQFTLADAARLLAFAKLHHLPRLSMWSLNRDQACGPNYADVEVVSDNCSGVAQDPAAFTNVFLAITSKGTTTSPAPSTSAVAPTPTADAVDDAATSPYAIWNPTQSYPKGTKTVWHHNVYEAKWYTTGDIPDAPVASLSDTPWTLLGPVLPGEHPAATPTLAAGTYPDWVATQVYVAGDRVLYDGTGYQAKWWTTGDVPGKSVLTPSDTPWTLLT